MPLLAMPFLRASDRPDTWEPFVNANGNNHKDSSGGLGWASTLNKAVALRHRIDEKRGLRAGDSDKLSGILMLLAAAMADSWQKELVEEHPEMAALVGLSRNELASMGLKKLMPGLTKKQVGVVTRVASDLLARDLAGAGVSVAREKIYQQRLKEATSGNERLAIKLWDAIEDVLIKRARLIQQ